MNSFRQKRSSPHSHNPQQQYQNQQHKSREKRQNHYTGQTQQGHWQSSFDYNQQQKMEDMKASWISLPAPSQGLQWGETNEGWHHKGWHSEETLGWNRPRNQLQQYYEPLIKEIQHQNWKVIEKVLIETLCSFVEWTPDIGLHRNPPKSPMSQSSYKDLLIYIKRKSRFTSIEKERQLLIFGILIKETLMLSGTMTIFDPYITNEDIQICQTLGIQVETRPIQILNKSLVWVPNVNDLSDLEELLKRHWGYYELSSISIMAPKLESLLSQYDSSQYSYLRSILPFTQQSYFSFTQQQHQQQLTALDREIKYLFGNQVVYGFPMANLHQLPFEFWLFKTFPMTLLLRQSSEDRSEQKIEDWKSSCHKK